MMVLVGSIRNCVTGVEHLAILLEIVRERQVKLQVDRKCNLRLLRQISIGDKSKANLGTLERRVRGRMPRHTKSPEHLRGFTPLRGLMMKILPRLLQVWLT